jgi:putative phage-type endonuclease
MKQGTEEWFAARCGKVTASRMADVMAKGRGGAEAATRKNYRAQLVAERLTGKVADSFSSAAMQWGTDTEPQARAAYEFYSGQTVTECGFVDHPTIPMTGASPDAFAGSDGLVEIKCPNTATHIDTLLNDVVPKKYVLQMHWQMACTGRSWCDFVSFDPRMPEDMALYVRRVEYNDELCPTEDVHAFLHEVAQAVTELQMRCRRAAA